MERRASSTDEIAELVYAYCPEGARGFYVDYKHPSGSIERQPPEGSWSLRPIRTVFGICEGLLHVHYVDPQGSYMKPASPEQRLVIDFVYGGQDRRPAASTTQPALESLGDLADKLGGAALPPGGPGLGDPEAEEEEEADAQEIAAVQEAQRRQLQLLSMDTLQSFMRDSLSHIVRLQEAATKNSQAQIETSIANLRLLSEQSTKLLETQLVAAQRTKDRMEELQPQPAPAPLDISGILASVLPFLQTLMMGPAHAPPGRPRLPPPRATLGAQRAEPLGEDLTEPEGADRTNEVVRVFRDMIEVDQIERLGSDPAFLEEFVERLRSASRGAPAGSAASRAPQPPAERRAPGAGRGAEGLRRKAGEAPPPPWQSLEEEAPPLAALIAELMNTPRA